jgi:hypothetical protein
VSHVYLSEALVSRVASDVMERSLAEVQLHDVLRTQDATLIAIVDAITRETHQQGIVAPSTSRRWARSWRWRLSYRPSRWLVR